MIYDCVNLGVNYDIADLGTFGEIDFLILMVE